MKRASATDWLHRRCKTIILLAGLLLLIAATPQWAKPVTVVPIAPMAWLLEQVAGQDLEIKTIVASGSSPHSFDLTPRQVADLTQAQIFFTLNLPLERQILDKLLAVSPPRPTINLNQGIALRYFSAEEAEFGGRHTEDKPHAGEPDPHTWLDPRNAARQAQNMALALAAFNPARGAFYHDNFQQLARRLEKLDARLAAALAPYQGQSFMVYHPAFSYLAARYGLKQVAVEIEGKEPTARRLSLLLDQARHYGIKIIFVQPQFSLAAAQRLASELDGRVVIMDPLAFAYEQNIESIIESLQMELK